MNFYTELKHNMRLVKADLEFKKKTNELIEKALEENKFACICMRAEKFDLALKHFTSAFETLFNQLEVKSTNILMNLGNLHAQQKQHEKAVEYYKSVIELSPYNDETIKVPMINWCSKLNAYDAYIDAHTNLACLLTNLDRPQEAYDFCLKAIELQPNNYEAQINFGDLLRQLGRQKEAIDHTWKQIVAASEGYAQPVKIDVKQTAAQPSDQVNVVCMKWGTKYGADYVNKLFRGIKRHCTRQFNFICVTDNTQDLEEGILTRELKKGWTGWWGKATLFMDYYEYPPGKMFYIDLDMIITENIDEIMEYNGPFAIMKTDELACEKQNKNGYNSSIVIWNNKDVFKRVFTELDVNWKNISKFIVRFDFWLEMIIENADFLQDIYPGQISDFVQECKDVFPQNTRIVAFPRMPKPDTYPAAWIKQHWI